MRYEIIYTKPSLKIQSVDDYKIRIIEIVKGQMRELIQPYRFLNIYFWLFAIFYIPFSFLYLAFCLVELIFDTVFLPLSLTPVIRILPFIIASVVWGCTYAVGVFSCVSLVYDVNEPIYNPLSKKETDSNKKPSPKNAISAPVVGDNNYLVCNRYIGDEDYGLVRKKPIYVSGLNGAQIYLNKLQTLDEQTVFWSLSEIIEAEEINGNIYCYASTLETGEFYKKVYININSTQIPKRSPLGFKFVIKK